MTGAVRQPKSKKQRNPRQRLRQSPNIPPRRDKETDLIVSIFYFLNKKTMKHVSDSERLTIAALNRRETELKEAREMIKQCNRETEALRVQVASLRESNQILCSQIQYLVSKYARQNA